GAVNGTATCIQYALASRPSMAKWKFGPGVCFLEAGDSPDASGGLQACRCRAMEAWPAISPQRLHFPIDCCLPIAELALPCSDGLLGLLGTLCLNLLYLVLVLVAFLLGAGILF